MRGGDNLDLSAAETETVIDRANLRFRRLRVGQENADGAAFDDGRRDRRFFDVSQRLRIENDGDLFFPQGLQPLPKPCREHRVIQKHPCLTEEKHGWGAIESFFQAREQVAQHGQNGGLAVHQLFHLEALHVGHSEPVVIGVEQLAVCAAEHIGRQGLAQRVGLQQHGEPGQRPLLHRRPGEAPKRRPDRRLLVGADDHAFMQQPAFHPFGRPSAVAFLVDARERLECDAAIGPEVIVLTAQAQDGGAQRAAYIESEDARSRVATELHRQGRHQHRLSHTGWADNHRVPYIANVRHQPERRRTIRAGDDQRRAVEMVVPLRPGPHRGQRHHVRQVQRGNDGLAHVRIGVAGDGRQPSIDRVERFGDSDEPASLDDALHHAQLFVRHAGIRVHHGDGGRQVAEGDLIAAQLLQGGISVGRLVAGVGINQRRLLLEDGFSQERDHVLALGKPLAAQAAEFLFCFGFVHADKARTPAVAEAQAVEVVQNPRPGRSRETSHRHHAQVLVAQRGRQAADQCAVSQQRVDVERHFGHAHAVASCRDGRVQIGQRFSVIEPGDFRHHAIEQVEDAIGFRDEGIEPATPVHAIAGRVLVEHLRGASTGFFRWQIGQRQVIAALEVVTRFLEGGAAFLVHEPGQRFGKVGMRIVRRRPAFGLDEQRPARPQPAQRVVEPCRRGDQLALRSAVQVRPAKARRALETAVLVQHHARRDQPGPGQPVGE